MTKLPKYLLFFSFAFCSIAWMACTQQRQVCLTPKSAFLNVKSVHFASDTATVPVDSSLPSAIFLALTFNGAKGYIATRQTTFTLSLSPDSTLAQWVYTPDSSVHHFDTLTFFYQRHLQFLSNACGYTYFYTIDSMHTTHFMTDSAHILNPGVTNDIKPIHVQIFVHPDF